MKEVNKVVLLDELKSRLTAYEEPLKDLRDSLSTLASKKLRIEELQKRLEEPGFWDDPETSQHVMKELKGLEDSVKEIEQLCSDYEDMLLLIEMSEEEPDEETSKEIEAELETFEATFEELRISTLLTGPV